MSREPKVPLTALQRQRLRATHEAVTTARVTGSDDDVAHADRARDRLRSELGYLPGGLELPITRRTRKGALADAISAVEELAPVLRDRLALEDSIALPTTTIPLITLAMSFRLLEQHGFQRGPHIVSPERDDNAQRALLKALRGLYLDHASPTPEQLLAETLVACGVPRAVVHDNWFRALQP